MKAKITRQQWFLEQQKNPSTVQVLKADEGPAMVKRLQTKYAHLDFPRFKSESVSIAYLPKTSIALREEDGSYHPNEQLLNQIPTPALAEMIHDPKKWTVHGKTMKELTGSEFTVSHFGLLYKKTFKQGELIYRRVTCDDVNDEKTVCAVKPIVCEEKQCTKLMFAHATDVHPRNFSWSRTNKGDYTCTASLDKNKGGSSCNRVELIPLYNYLTDYQYGRHYFMEWPSFVGVHIEQLTY